MGPMPQLFWPALTVVSATALALILRAVLLGGVERWAPPGSTPAAVAETVRLPSLLWSLVLGLYVGMEISELPRRFAHPLGLTLQAAVIASVTVTAAGVVGMLIRRSGERSALAAAVTGLGQTVARGVVLAVGFLVVLSALGIEITPILTALGVGGLAVALALQDTLSNFFAGVHLLADRPIRVGDYVKIADNVEGYVADVGWRSTRVRTLLHMVVVVPNKRVAESIITNYDLPEPRVALLIRIGVSYDSDPEQVERVLIDETVRAIGDISGLLADPAPVARLIPGFGEYSLDFTITCHVATFVDQYTVQHELRKRLLRRLRSERIDIPFPTQMHLEAPRASAGPDGRKQPEPADHPRG